MYHQQLDTLRPMPYIDILFGVSYGGHGFYISSSWGFFGELLICHGGACILVPKFVLLNPE